jgi:hypothetical protein
VAIPLWQFHCGNSIVAIPLWPSHGTRRARLYTADWAIPFIESLVESGDNNPTYFRNHVTSIFQA